MTNKFEDGLRSAIAERIKRFRLRDVSGVERVNKLSQTDLAKEVRVSRTTIANIENEKQFPSFVVLYRICHALGVRLTDILPPVSKIVNIEGVTTDSEFARKYDTVEIKGTVHPLPTGLGEELKSRFREKGENS